MYNTNAAINEKKGFIFNIQRYNVYDGPGIRTLVFFKGCPLRCKWCSNPEGMEPKYKVMFKENLCLNCGACSAVCPVGIHSMLDGIHIINRDIDCVGCRRCEKTCTEKAIAIVGEYKTVSELLEIIEEDRAFYEISGGGVTLGGGEVLMQADFATELLKECKQRGINTAIETCGYAKKESILKIAEYTDLFLFDLKHIDSNRHHELTGVYNELIHENLIELLSRGHDVKIRMPMLKDINSSQAEIEGISKFLMPFKDYKNFKGIDLLPYHKLGVNKYNQLGKDYPIEGDPSLSNEELDKIENWIKKYDFPVKVVKH